MRMPLPESRRSHTRASRRLRWQITAALLAVQPATAEIRSADACRDAIAEDAAAAREEAALWTRKGGGPAARLCEVAALEAMGATGMAARLATAIAQNPNRAIGAGLRATVYEDAARLWLVADRPDLGVAALAAADGLTTTSRLRERLRARLMAAAGDWPGAIIALERVLEDRPDDAASRALLAAAKRRGGDPAAALAQAERALADDPDLPEARFEQGAALAELGRSDRARAEWLALIAATPDHPMATLARRNLQALP